MAPAFLPPAPRQLAAPGARLPLSSCCGVRLSVYASASPKARPPRPKQRAKQKPKPKSKSKPKPKPKSKSKPRPRTQSPAASASPFFHHDEPLQSSDEPDTTDTPDSPNAAESSDAAAAQHPLPQSTDYADWSSDFLHLCNQQLSLIMATLPNVDLVALFFRHQNEHQGTLEFVPLIVHSADRDRDRDHANPSRVWIASAVKGLIELESTSSPPHILPGSLPAQWLLPDYPFTSVSHHGGISLPDGGLCVPVEYNDVVAGTILLRPSRPSPHHQWNPAHIRRVVMVAKSIALAAALEGKWHAYKGILGSTGALLDSVRSLLNTTLHQIRSPLQALVTFGHLMLRKLPVKDSNRDLAKHVIVEALRIDDLLKPLDEARETLVLPEADHIDARLGISTPPFNLHSVPKPPTSAFRDRPKQPPPDLDLDQTFFPSPASSESPQPFAGSEEGLQVIDLTDILHQLAERTAVLTSEKDIVFSVDVDDSTRNILAVDKFVREAITNLIDNALKYSPPCASIGITNRLSPTLNKYSDFDDDLALPDGSAWVVIWDTGYGFSTDEQHDVWEFGYRGSAARRTAVDGSGLGLGITKQLIRSCKAEIELVSPLPGMWDPRTAEDRDDQQCPGSAFILSFSQPKQPGIYQDPEQVDTAQPVD